MAKKSVKPKKYPLEDVRNFVAKRSWFTVGEEPWHLFTHEEYEKLKNRELSLKRTRANYIKAFIDGYCLAKYGGFYTNPLTKRFLAKVDEEESK